MTINNYLKRRLPLYSHEEVARQAKRQRKDVDTEFEEPLRLLGGATPGGGASPNERESAENPGPSFEIVSYGRFVTSVYQATRLDLPKGWRLVRDRETLRQGQRAWGLFTKAFGKDNHIEVIKRALVNPGGFVPSFNAMLLRVAAPCLQDGNLTFPDKNDFRAHYDRSSQRMECAELMHYMTAILAWMVSTRPLRQRLGYERLYVKARLYHQIWRLGTVKALYADGTRPPRERQILYGVDAQNDIRGYIQRTNDHLRLINLARRRMDAEGNTATGGTPRAVDPFGNLWLAYRKSSAFDSTPFEMSDKIGNRERSNAGSRSNGRGRQGRRSNEGRGGSTSTEDEREPSPVRIPVTDPASLMQYTEWEVWLANRAMIELLADTADRSEFIKYEAAQTRFLLQIDNGNAVAATSRGDFWPAPCMLDGGGGRVEL